jgi:hypothetical protein
MGRIAETANVVTGYYLLTKEKRMFAVFACSKQTEVCRHYFLFA